MHRYRAIAVDYDGTLTTTPHPRDDVLDAVREYRRAGGRMVLCTGRILSELRADFPSVDAHFDAIVGENGAVLWLPESGERMLAPPVDEALERVLRAHGIPLRRGRVLLAGQGRATAAAAESIAQLGIDAQLVHNRSELMVLPAGVTKGSGLIEALGELGISYHSTVAIGDAENDHALLDACELGAAVSNAVPSLQQRADVVLGRPAGDGVVEFLRGPVLRGEIVVHPVRWRLEIGSTVAGPVSLPGSNVDILVVGATGSGKSHLSGLVMERAIMLGYSVCVFDPEGDHRALENLRGCLRIGGTEPMPPPAEMVRVIRHRFGSVVVDLSLLEPREQTAYWREALPLLDQLRAESALPHLIVLEEADRLLDGEALSRPDPRAPSTGYCLVTYRPEDLAPAVLDEIDCVLALRGAEAWARIPLRGSGGELPQLEPETCFILEPGTALLADRDGTRAFVPAPRRTAHVRHWHKYVRGHVPPNLAFFFRTHTGLTGRKASNLSELHRELRRAAAPVLAHHLSASDVSSWLQDVIQDDRLAEQVREIERWYQCGHQPGIDVARRALLRAIERRYGGNGMQG